MCIISVNSCACFVYCLSILINCDEVNLFIFTAGAIPNGDVIPHHIGGGGGGAGDRQLRPGSCPGQQR